MKFKRKRIMTLLLSMMLVSLMGMTVYAKSVPDISKLCSLTITMQIENIPVGGGTLTLYRVGEVVEDDGNYGFQPVGDFVACGESFADLDNSELGERLMAFADSNSIAGMVTNTIGADGVVNFDDLQTGLYLVAQHEAAEGYYAIVPFLVSLPYLDTGVYKYDLVAEPKTELLVKPTPTEPTPTPVEPTPTPTEPIPTPAEPTPTPTEPTPTPTEPTPTPVPSLPQTGQLWWPVPVLVSFGVLLLGAGIALNRRKE